ncbi:MAG: hypothetical protein V1857_03280 [archaeon]
MEIDTTCGRESFRRFMILSTCESYIPRELDEDPDVFPERASEIGAMYVEAEDKQTVTVLNEITFTRVSNVLGVIYNSKSGSTRLKWRSLKADMGKLTGEASLNSIVNLYTARALGKEFMERARVNTTED